MITCIYVYLSYVPAAPEPAASQSSGSDSMLSNPMLLTTQMEIHGVARLVARWTSGIVAAK